MSKKSNIKCRRMYFFTSHYMLTNLFQQKLTFCTARYRAHKMSILSETLRAHK
jgi:hypothetical protein